MILDKIVLHKKIQLKNEKSKLSIKRLKENMGKMQIPKPLDFSAALRKPGEVALIAEVKKASPSKGVMREKFDPVDIALQYYNGGADAISVLTEKEFFLGDDRYLSSIKREIPIPVLRKDFIIDQYQIYQARLIGADAILLIVSILRDDELLKFQEIAEDLGMWCLVEVHSESEMERAIKSEAKIIGINNRNLNNFETNLTTTERLMKMIPDDVIKVSESGIKDHHDIEYLKGLGVNAVLIGESLVRSVDIGAKIRNLRFG